MVSVWLNDDDDAQLFESHIKELDQDSRRILIDPPPLAQEDLREGMASGTVIALDCFTQSGHLIVYPTIHSIQHTGLKGYWLSVPKDVEYTIEQLRSYVRVPFHQPIKVQLMDPKTGNFLQSLDCVAQNLSGGGLQFAGLRNLQAGCEAIVYLELSDGTMSSRIQILKTWENESEFVDKTLRYISTAHFQDLSREDETRIINECFRLELERGAREKNR